MKNETANSGDARYWLVLPSGGRQLIDPREFDLARVAEQAERVGARLVLESPPHATGPHEPRPAAPASASLDAPVSMLKAMFRHRFDRIYLCEIAYHVDINTRPTTRVLGGYYHKRRLIRVYSHDIATGRRATEELWDTFLHEMAHHLEYTEPHSFNARKCQRVRGRMHSGLFWFILSVLKRRWAELQQNGGADNWSPA